MLSLQIFLQFWDSVSVLILPALWPMLIYFSSQIRNPCSLVLLVHISDSSFVPPLVYVVLGSSMDLAVGPVSIASLVLGSMITEEVSPTAQPDLFLQLALTSTFFAGIFQAALGVLRSSFPSLHFLFHLYKNSNSKH